MKKSYFFILISLFLISGCMAAREGTKVIQSTECNQETEAILTSPGADASRDLQEEHIEEITENITEDTAQKIIEEEATDHSFFFDENVKEVTYEGSFLFDDIIQKEVKLSVNPCYVFDDGSLYELQIQPVEGIPDERLHLGYFYIEQDKIYRLQIAKGDIDSIKTREQAIENAVIVCQDEAMKDTLGEEEGGWHQSIEAYEDQREYHFYNNQNETGFYETFIWQKGKGLISYRSGYGAERDAIELNIL